MLEVIARSAADLLEIHSNSAALYYTKIHKIIAYHLEQEALEIFDGENELDESYFDGTRKRKRGRGQELAITELIIQVTLQMGTIILMEL